MLAQLPVDKKTQPVCRKNPPRNLGFLLSIIRKRKKIPSGGTSLPPKYLNQKLGWIGLGIFLIIGFFAVTADILAPFPWEYSQMIYDNGPTPYGSVAQTFTGPADTNIFRFADPPPNAQLTQAGLVAPDSIHFAVESDAQVPEDLDHARFIYALCPFNVLPVLDGVDFTVSLEIEEAQCVGLEEGGFMVQVEVNDNIAGNWTMVDREALEFSNYLRVGESNTVRLSFVDISASPVKLVLKWSPIRWLEGSTPRQIDINETILTRGTTTGWKYSTTGIRELSKTLILRYGLPPFSWNEDGTRFHPLGTDLIGHDILTGLMYSARMALITGFLAMAIATAIGVVVGVMSRYSSKVIDDQLAQFSALFDNIPVSIMLFLYLIGVYLRYISLIFLISPIQESFYFAGDYGATFVIAIIFGLTGWIGIVRVTRNQLPESGEEISIDLKQILVNALPVIALGIAEVIFLEASILSLGFGNPSTPTWGRMIQLGLPGMRYAAWVFVFPFFTVVLAILSLVLISFGLRARLISQMGKEQEIPTPALT
ncbi:MAG: ABC transporter permease [Candidatus Hodarchaeota archaeon]